VLAGDSPCNQGLDPAVIRERTGAEAVNLCTIGNMLAVNDAWILDAWIRTHGPPKRVIVMHAWDIWSRDHEEMPLAQVPRPAGFWEEESPALHPSAWTVLRYAYERWVPIYGQRTSFAKALTAPERWFVPPAELDGAGFMRVSKGDPAWVRKDAADHLKAAKKKHKKVSADNRAGLDRLVALADQHGFALDLAPGPVWEGLLDDATMVSALQRTRRDLSKWAGPRVRVLGDPVPFADTEMENADHVLGSARRRPTQPIGGRARGQ